MAAYSLLGLNWDYSRFEVTEHDLATFLASTELSAASLTMPLKDEAFNLVSTSDSPALAARAVNTIVRSEFGWVGYNTDVFGLTAALAGQTFETALVLGSGATARNALLAIRALNPSATVGIHARNLATADGVVSFGLNQGLNVSMVGGKPDLSLFDLTISTLPPDADTTGWFAGQPKGTLLDVAYKPWPSQLAKLWLASGGNVVSGIQMLIWQAIAQIRIFKNGNVAAPLENEQEIAEVMRTAALAEG